MEDLEHVQIVHACIVENGIEPGLSMQSILIDMYCKCGSVENAEMIFIRLSRRNEVMCNALLLGHTLHKHIDKAFHVFNQMQQEGIKASLATFLGILKACSKVPMVDQGRQIHAQIIESELDTDLCIQNSLMNIYVKGSCMLDAFQVFDSLSCKDAVSFSSMMEVCYHFVENTTAFRLFYQMLQECILPNQTTYVIILRSCSSLVDAKVIHCYVIENGFERQLCLGNILICMYIKYGRLDPMHEVFRNLGVHDSGTWVQIITAYARSGNNKKAVQIFQEML